MRLIFVGTFPGWLVASLAVLCLAFTWWAYRGQALPKPWALLLPTARALALLLLLLALRQPVLSRIQRFDARGRLPIIVDTSGSMSIIDSYTPAEKVETAWHLALFARELRSTVFADSQAGLERLARDLDDLAATLESWGRQLAVDSPSREIDAREARQLARQAAELQAAARKLQATVDEAVAGTAYLAADHPGAVPDGRLTYERYANLPGWELDSLQDAADYPDSPTASALLGEFRAPANVDEHYGARLRGWLQPPASGKYVFAIAADDQAALYLGDDDKPANLRRIAFVPSWVKAEEYNRYPQQRSAEILLDKSRIYYLEAIFKEQLGDDHCSVAWWRPDGREESPIPGVYFSAMGRTVEQRRFTRELTAVAGDLNRAVEAAAALVERLGKLRPGQPEAAAAERLAVARKAARQAAAWKNLLGPFADLQRRADEALAGAGVEGVDTALRKLARMSRLDLCQHLLLKGALKLDRLERLGVVELFGLHEPLRPLPPAKIATGLASPDLPYTRLGSAIQEVVAFYGQQPIAAILLLTDGNNNSGRPLGEVGQMLRERQIPLFAVGVGLTTPPADISLEAVIAPTSSFKGDRLSLSAVVRRHGFTHRPITLQVKSGNEVLGETLLPPGPDAVTTVDLSFVENSDGFRHYLVEAEVMAGEVLDSNNRRTVSVNILADPVRALLIDQFPRWESRHAKMMLERDARLELTTRFLDVERQQLPAPPPPPTRPALFAHDILVLGDVDPELFGPAWLEDLRAFVVERGGCLVLMAGPAFMPQAYRETTLADILPLHIQPQPLLPEQPSTTAAAGLAWPLKLTEAGRYANLVQIGTGPEVVARLWETLPPLNWRREGVFPAANAELLVVAGDDQAPIMLTAYAGLGKILYLGSDSFWRWRYRSRRTFHQRLWGQILLWATLGRTTGTDEHIKLMTDRPEYSPGETVTLQARVFDRDKMPLEDGTVSADLRLADGPVVRSVKFAALANSGGEYRAQVRDLPAGRYVATPRVVELAGLSTAADYPFEIRDLPTSEFIELALDEAALRTLTREYRHLSQAADLPARLPRLQQVEEHRQDVEIWDSPWLLVLVAALLGAEWQMRKKLNRV